jgi:microcystin-dependent protein
MSSPYIGQIMIFGGNFAPQGWALCQGQLLPISGYETLYSLIGTTYGGDGQNTFALPDLQGRVPLHMGQGPNITQNYVMGENGGVEGVILDSQHLPSHNHSFQAANVGDANTPGPTTMLANEGGADASKVSIYAPFDYTPANMTTLAPGSVAAAGGGEPHDNMQPFLVVNFVISLFGVYPSQA